MANTIRISQVYGGGGNSGATYKNDFIELFNSGAIAVSLTGWSVQYASATGTSWQVTNLSGSIAPGSYYLVQEAAGTGGTTNLPTPDATGSIAMSKSDGKVALVSTTTALSGGCPTTNVVDFVGFGGADCREGTGATSALSNTTAALRNGNGCTDTDQNAADFTIAAPAPRNSATTANACGANTSVVPTCPVSLNAIVGNAVSGPVSASDSDGTVITATITSAAVTGITLDGVTPASSVGGALTGTLNVSSSTAQGNYSVILTFTNADSPTPQTATCTVPVTISPVGGACPAATLTPIYTIQGSGATSPLVNTAVTFNGIVTGDFQAATQLNGFYVQDENGDGNPATSDGIFVFAGTAVADVAVGDRVQVKGTVKEYLNDLTEISPVTSVTICNSATLPTPVEVTLPETTDGDLERYEGMYVHITSTMTVAQTYFLGRYGQMTLSASGRLYQPTNLYAPGSAAALAEANLIARSLLILDDGRDAVKCGDNPNPVPYLGTPPPAVIRAGDTVTNLYGILDYGQINSGSTGSCSAAGTLFDREYRLHPTSQQPVFIPSNPRPATPPTVGGNLKVAGTNVLNYFNTFGTTACATGVGGASTACRGAANATEFQRQSDKLVAAITGMNADVVGIMEMENDGYGASSAIQDLVTKLNAAAGAGTYAFVDVDTRTSTLNALGVDAIKVGMLYKPAKVNLLGTAALNSLAFTDPRTLSTQRSRPSLAQTFQEKTYGEIFTVVVNHLKSKGSSCGVGDDDATTGQGSCNGTRTDGASYLVNTWLPTHPTGSSDPDVLLIGDMNAYAKEDPITQFVNAGYTDLVSASAGTSGYSYIFDGQSGYLDHALASSSLLAQVARAEEWHINADEPEVINYSTSFNPTGYYTANQYRASDHDPVIIGFNLCPAVAAPTGIGIAQNSATDLTLTWPAVQNAATYRVWRDTAPYFAPTSSPITAAGTSPYPDPGRIGDPATNYYYMIAAVNACGQASSLSNRVGEFDFALVPGQ